MHKQAVLGSSAVLLIPLFLIAFSLSPASASSGSSLSSVDAEWSCSGSDGFSSAPDPNQYCYSESDFTSDTCMHDRQLEVWDSHCNSRDYCQEEYEFEFEVPAEGKYSCTITATANHFDHRCGEDNDEMFDVYLTAKDGEKKHVGLSEDPWCPADPSGGTGGCDNGDDDGDDDGGGCVRKSGYSWLGPGTISFNGDRYCFKVTSIQNAAQGVNGGDNRKVIAAFGNPNDNRHYIILRYRWNDGDHPIFNEAGPMLEIRSGCCILCTDWCEYDDRWLPAVNDAVYEIEIVNGGSGNKILYSKDGTLHPKGAAKPKPGVGSVYPEGLQLDEYCTMYDTCYKEGAYGWLGHDIGFEEVAC